MKKHFLSLALALITATYAEAQSKVEPAPFPTLGEAVVKNIAAEKGGTFTFAWPIEHVQVNSLFGMRKDPVKKRKKAKVRLHAGIDLDGDVGDTVISTGPGKVLHAGWNAGYGNYILIQHENGYFSHYGHLSEILVYRGQLVRQGAPIGLVGSTGHSTGPHLHFGITKDEKWLNPEAVLGKSSTEQVTPASIPSKTIEDEAADAVEK